MIIELQRAAAILALGVFASACAATQEAVEEPEPGASQETELEVSSQHRNDVRVYAVGRGAPVRLGVVRTMETRTFELPADVLSAEGSVRLIANPVGAPHPHQTDFILLRPGDLVEWSIEDHLVLSSYRVTGGGSR